jgi:hypothetical protein
MNWHVFGCHNITDGEAGTESFVPCLTELPTKILLHLFSRLEKSYECGYCM